MSRDISRIHCVAKANESLYTHNLCINAIFLSFPFNLRRRKKHCEKKQKQTYNGHRREAYTVGAS